MRVMLAIGLLGGGGSERKLLRFVERARHRVELAGFLCNPGGVWDEAVSDCLARCYIGGGSRAHKVLGFDKAVLRERPTLIHAWHTQALVYPVLAWPLHRRPMIVNVFGDLTRSSDDARRALEPSARLLRFASATVVNSDHLTESLQRAGVTVPRPTLIPNGIELPTLPLHPIEAAAGAGPSPLKLCGVGTLKALKNWQQALRIAAALRATGRDVRLTVYGEGPDGPSLLAQAAALGFDPQATFPGFFTDVAQRLVDHDLLLHPSRSEGQPNAVLEGLAAGLPAVTADLGAYLPMQPNGAFLRTHAADDDAGALAALSPWLDDVKARRAAGAAGRAFVADGYGVDLMVDRFLALYRNLAP